ncbi:hypothetical protein AMTR_s00012p00086780 [Amborella trichopoda]|uniref:Uncharacterized protein n=1 Tax=Amborella trichopoda TaxID=13333 RepID=W1PCW7_AMBTC|nr:hypothetical protein AMTR_s00012p00086780 [Amborella trichopoda]
MSDLRDEEDEINDHLPRSVMPDLSDEEDNMSFFEGHATKRWVLDEGVLIGKGAQRRRGAQRLGLSKR